MTCFDDKCAGLTRRSVILLRRFESVWINDDGSSWRRSLIACKFRMSVRSSVGSRRSAVKPGLRGVRLTFTSGGASSVLKPLRTDGPEQKLCPMSPVDPFEG